MGGRDSGLGELERETEQSRKTEDQKTKHAEGGEQLEPTQRTLELD